MGVGMSLPYYKRFPRDFLEGSIGMGLETKGAYAIVLDLIYMRDGRLPDDPRFIAGQLGCSVRKWTAIREELIARGKLKIEAGFISNFRADYLLEETRKYRDKQAEIASKPRKNNTLQQPQPIQPEPEPEKIIEANASLSSAPPPASPMTYPEPFEAAWKAYPHVKGRSSKPKALGHWRRLSPATRQALPSAVARYARDGREPKAECGAPAMQRWLADARFADWMPEAESSAGVWTDDRWSAVVALNRDEGWWSDNLGPKPGEPGCRVPAHLIERRAA